MPTSELPRLLDLVAYVVASPVQRPTGRGGRLADRLSRPGSRSVQSRSGTGRWLPTFAACEANEQERQRHSCYDRPHIPRPPVSRKREAPPPRPLVFVSYVLTLNVDPVSAWRQNDVVPDRDPISAERQRNRCMPYSGTFVESEVFGDAAGTALPPGSGQDGGRVANRSSRRACRPRARLGSVEPPNGDPQAPVPAA